MTSILLPTRKPPCNIIHLVTHKKYNHAITFMHYPCIHIHALSMHSILLSTRNITIHHSCIIHASCIYALFMQQSCYPQEHNHALSMHSFPCIIFYALPIVHCHSSWYLQDHKHAITFILLFTRSQLHRSNIIKCPLRGSTYSKPHA